MFERSISNTDNDVFLNVVSADGTTTQFSTTAPLPVANGGSNDDANPAVAAAGNTALVVYRGRDGANIVARLFNGSINLLGTQFTIADHRHCTNSPPRSPRSTIIATSSSTTTKPTRLPGFTTAPASARSPPSSGSMTRQAIAFLASRPAGKMSSPSPQSPPTADLSSPGYARRAPMRDILARRFNSDGLAMGQAIHRQHS